MNQQRRKEQCILDLASSPKGSQAPPVHLPSPTPPQSGERKGCYHQEFLDTLTRLGPERARTVALVLKMRG